MGNEPNSKVRFCHLPHKLIFATEIKLDDIIHLAAKQRAFHFERQGKLGVNVRTNLSLALEARLYPQWCLNV